MKQVSAAPFPILGKLLGKNDKSGGTCVQEKGRDKSMDIDMFSANDLLRDYYGEFTNEITKLHRSLACGCSMCILFAMQQRHPEIELPEGGIIG